MNDLVAKLAELQRRLRAALRAEMERQSSEVLSRSARDGAGDTIFGIDIAAEEVLLRFCEEWGKETCFVLVAEGLEPEAGVTFGSPGSSGPELRVIIDPIDGSRGLMYDKRSAWSLAAVAPDRGPETKLSDITHAVMTELPTTRQATSDVLWATRGERTLGRREPLDGSAGRDLDVTPSSREDLLHGFATVANYFPGGKELTSRVEEELFRLERGGWNPEKAEVYTDQYISSGGALAELALGRDRFVLDIRPLVHEHIGAAASLCCRPYDLCAALVAQQAGCVVTAPDGSPLDAPLDVTTNVAYVGYANQRLAARVQPMVVAALGAHGLL